MADVRVALQALWDSLFGIVGNFLTGLFGWLGTFLGGST
jgi:hypothetical protein